MLQSLQELAIEPVVVTRPMLATYLGTGKLPTLPERLMLVDASIDYADMRGHEAEKHAFISCVAERCSVELIASFSSGATDFDDALITNPFYREYKRVKQDNLTYLQSLGSRLFYPKIYTLIGPSSFALRSTGWVQVLEQTSICDEVSIAHPHQPRSWVAEHCVQLLFASFAASKQRDYLDAPVCGTFRLADIVSFCEVRRGRNLKILPGQASSWLTVPYVAPHPARVEACTCDLQSQLALLLDTSPHR